MNAVSRGGFGAALSASTCAASIKREDEALHCGDHAPWRLVPDHTVSVPASSLIELLGSVIVGQDPERSEAVALRSELCGGVVEQDVADALSPARRIDVEGHQLARACEVFVMAGTDGGEAHDLAIVERDRGLGPSVIIVAKVVTSCSILREQGVEEVIVEDAAIARLPRGHVHCGDG